MAGGTGSRLWPATLPVCKQLLPVYDKPMIYYPLSTLMLAGIRDILIITTPVDVDRFETLLGDGSRWGLSLSYMTQQTPGGIAQAFVLGASFVGRDPCCLILGDNIFYGSGLADIVLNASTASDGAVNFAYWVQDPRRYGVVELSPEGRPLSLHEKPANPRSNWAVTGLYFYDNAVLDMARALKPSARGELEITHVNQMYLEQGRLSVAKLGRGFAWLDAGTQDSLLQASEFIFTIEQRQGLKIGCPEEVAYRMGYIDAAQLEKLAQLMAPSDYGSYLSRVLSMGT